MRARLGQTNYSNSRLRIRLVANEASLFALFSVCKGGFESCRSASVSLLLLFRWLVSHKFSIQQQVLANLSVPAMKKGSSIQEGQPNEQLGGTCCSCHASYSCRRRSLFLTHYRYDVGLPGGNTYLANVESYKKNQNSQPETWHQRHQNDLRSISVLTRIIHHSRRHVALSSGWRPHLAECRKLNPSIRSAQSLRKNG